MRSAPDSAAVATARRASPAFTPIRRSASMASLPMVAVVDVGVDDGAAGDTAGAAGRGTGEAGLGGETATTGPAPERGGAGLRDGGTDAPTTDSPASDSRVAPTSRSP